MTYILKKYYRIFTDNKEQEYNDEEYIKVFNSMIDAMSTSNIKEMVNADNALRNL